MDELKSVSKAIAGALATLVVAWLARHNVVVDNASVEAVLQFLLAAGVGFVTVYFAPKNREQ